MTERVVAVTGATGFIGRALVNSLLQHGWHVRALTRRPATADHPRLQWVTGDLHDLEALQILVSGAHAVVHCAGVTRGASAADFNQANVTGTLNLVGASVGCRPWPRFLFLSSLAAREPELSWYAASKRLAEQILPEQADAMPWTVFRPTAVYGPGDRELRPLFDAMRRGILPVVGHRDGHFSLLHVHDLVAAIRCWLEHPRPARGIYELDDGTRDGYTWQGVKEIAAREWRQSIRTLPVPAALLYCGAIINLALARIFRYAPMLTPGKLRELRHPDWRCDHRTLTTETGWRPRITLADALKNELLSPLTT